MSELVHMHFLKGIAHTKTKNLSSSLLTLLSHFEHLVIQFKSKIVTNIFENICFVFIVIIKVWFDRRVSKSLWNCHFCVN